MDIHYITSSRLETVRRITVLQPPRPHGSRPSRLPVLYLNDGQNLFDPARAFAGITWGVPETVTLLIRRGLIPPLIVVGIDHGEMRRGREYLPVEDERNPYSRHPLGRRHAAFVTSEVMPFVARNYPVGEGASNTGFGGSSYGAVAALYTALTYPGLFGRLLIESPPLHVGNGYLLRRARNAARRPARVYLGVGTAETRRPDWNEETVSNVRKLEAVLRRAGLGPRRLKVVVEEGATHSESAWAKRLPDALTFLFG